MNSREEFDLDQDTNNDEVTLSRSDGRIIKEDVSKVVTGFFSVVNSLSHDVLVQIGLAGEYEIAAKAGFSWVTVADRINGRRIVIHGGNGTFLIAAGEIYDLVLPDRYVIEPGSQPLLIAEGTSIRDIFADLDLLEVLEEAKIEIMHQAGMPIISERHDLVRAKLILELAVDQEEGIVRRLARRFFGVKE